MRIPGWAWLAWFLVCFVWFAVMEGIALWNGKPNDTLTATISRNLPQVVLLLGLIGFFGWFLRHMIRAYRDKDGMR